MNFSLWRYGLDLISKETIEWYWLDTVLLSDNADPSLECQISNIAGFKAAFSSLGN